MNYAPEVTGIGSFTAGLAEHLAQVGWEVNVATTFPHYPRWKVDGAYADQLQMTEHLSGVTVRRSFVPMPRRGSAASRILYDSSFALGALANSLRRWRPQVIVGVVPPIQAGLVVGCLARLRRVPCVLLVQDLAVDAAVSVGLVESDALIRAGRRLELATYRVASRIVVITPLFKQRLVELGISNHAISVIPNWVDVNGIHPAHGDTETRALLGAGRREFLVLHAGNMGRKQDLHTPVQAALAATDEDRFTLALVGDGSERISLEQIVTRAGSRSVKLLPLQPPERFGRMLAAADVLLISQREDVVDSVAPSKMLTYMAAARPILAAVHPKSEVARVVSEAACGLVVPPSDRQGLINGIAELKRSSTFRQTLGKNGRKFVETRFSREVVLGQWDELLGDLLPPA